MLTQCTSLKGNKLLQRIIMNIIRNERLHFDISQVLSLILPQIMIHFEYKFISESYRRWIEKPTNTMKITMRYRLALKNNENRGKVNWPDCCRGPTYTLPDHCRHTGGLDWQRWRWTQCRWQVVLFLPRACLRGTRIAMVIQRPFPSSLIITTDGSSAHYSR